MPYEGAEVERGSVPQLVSGYRSMNALLVVLAAVTALVYLSMSVAGEYTYHDQIEIDSDGAFTALNGVNSGSGTVTDPYVISGWRIDCDGGIGISVEGTTKHFIIRDVQLINGSENHSVGIKLEQIENGVIQDCLFEDIDPMDINDSRNIQILDCIFKDCGSSVDARYSENIVCRRLRQFTDDAEYEHQGGIFLLECWYTEITECDLSYGLGSGIVFFEGGHHQVGNCTLSDWGERGISYYGSHDNPSPYISIDNCTIDSCDEGIELHTSIATIRDCTVTNSEDVGILCFWEVSSTIQDNFLANNTKGIFVRHPEHFWVEDNVVVSSDEIGIEIHGGYSADSFERNTVKDSTIGISLVGSSSVRVRDNVVMSSSEIGLKMHNCHDTYVIDCIVEDSQLGFFLNRIYWTTIEGNQIEHCGQGILVNISGRSELRDNQISFCSEEAMVIEYGFSYANTWNASIHHNLFIMNNMYEGNDSYRGPQAYDEGINSTWDDGVEGNYWSDYKVRYPNAKAIGGIWDTPYDVDGPAKAIDRYPLADAFDQSPPVANASVDQTVDQYTNVTFDGTNSTDDYAIVSYTWVFMYGEATITLQGSMPKFTFIDPGNYTVTLTVSDVVGNQGTDDVNITVLDIEPPMAIAGDDITIGLNETFTLDGTASRDNVGIARWTWSLSSTDTEQTFERSTVSLSLNITGTYSAVLNISDSAGNWATDELLINVLDNVLPIPKAGEDITCDMDETFQLNGTGSWDNEGIAKYVWTLHIEGDVLVLSGSLIEHSLHDPGDYSVTLTVVDLEGNEATDEVMVHVLDIEPPVANAGADRTIGMEHFLALDGTGSQDNVGIVLYQWSSENDIIDGTWEGSRLELGQLPIGDHSFTLIVTDAAGNLDDDTVTITVLDTEPPVAVAGQSRTVIEDTIVTLDASGSSDNIGIVRFVWSIEMWGIVEELPGDVIELIVDEVGIINVTLTVTDAEGNEGKNGLVISVIPLMVPWELGPFHSTEGMKLHSVEVSIEMNGTIYTDASDDKGWTLFTVNRHDRVGTVVVKAKKSGYYPLEFKVLLDADGDPIDPVPPMEPIPPMLHQRISFWLVLITVIVVSILAGLEVSRRRKEAFQAATNDAGDPER